MLIPEYSISSQILKNISTIEYGKGVIENTTILPNWNNQLKRDAVINDTYNVLSVTGYNVLNEIIKKTMDQVSENSPKEIRNYLGALALVEEIAQTKEFDEEDIKKIHFVVSEGILPKTKRGRYRSIDDKQGSKPEEILANMVELLDWYHSLDSMETHPVLRAAIMRAHLEEIQPFEKTNHLVSNLVSLLVLKTNEYAIENFYCISAFYTNVAQRFETAFDTIYDNDGDLTKWLEYFTDGMAREITNLKEKIILLARDTKVAKASGKVDLTERQQKIVVYLQDYGLIQNKDFSKLFPDISEDTVLRDLKVLLTKGIVVKKGKTKSSRYELKA